MISADDERWMRRALALAARGLRTCPPNPVVGCLLVNDGRVVGAGWHRRTGEAHAEVLALREAGAAARGACAYVTLEPCSHQGRTPPCAPALVDAGLGRVVVAVIDPDPRVAGRGVDRLRAAGIRVETGPGAPLARRLNRGFFSRVERGRPWLTLKLAASLDGRVALGNGASRWITGPVARAAVHRRRARAGAVMTGVGTVIADDPELTVRLPGVERQPLRAIIDTRLRTPASARLFGGDGPVHLFCVECPPGRRGGLEDRGARIHCVGAEPDGRARLAEVLARLAALEVNELYVEAGPVLTGALLRQNLVDELEIFFGPYLLGPGGRPLAQLPDLDVIPEPPPFAVEWARPIGRDLRVRLRPLPGKP